MKLPNWAKLGIMVLACELAGIVGSIFTIPAIAGWYAGLTKSAFAPPSWVFGPAWTTLYFLMGVAAYLIWRKGEVRALYVFWAQLTANVLWSYFFFGMHNPALALFDIVLLWVLIFWTIAIFAKISRSAAYMLIPYIAWVSFAAYLNYSIWMLN